MNEDYLWDKSGEDAEIQNLENTLKAFRYQETAPPELPARILTIAKENRRGFFHWKFAFAAFASVLAIVSIVWLAAGNKQVSPAETIAEINAPQNNSEIADKFVEIAPKVESFKTAAKNELQTSVRVVKISRRIAPAVRRNKSFAFKAKPGKLPETLTAQEKYAYDQLMLALSITGEKLNIVKQAIDGSDEKIAANDGSR